MRSIEGQSRRMKAGDDEQHRSKSRLGGGGLGDDVRGGSAMGAAGVGLTQMARLPKHHRARRACGWEHHMQNPPPPHNTENMFRSTIEQHKNEQKNEEFRIFKPEFIKLGKWGWTGCCGKTWINAHHNEGLMEITSRHASERLNSPRERRRK